MGWRQFNGVGLGLQVSTPIVVSNVGETTIPAQAVIHKPTPNQVLAGTISVRAFVSAKLQSAALLLDGAPWPTPVSVLQITTLPVGVSLPAAPSYGKAIAELNTTAIPDGPHTLALELTVNAFIVRVALPPTQTVPLEGLGQATRVRLGPTQKIIVQIPVGKATSSITPPGPYIHPPAPPETPVPPLPGVSWFDQELISGIPNKYLLLGGIGLYLLTQKESPRG
jgi:hypothetical protein